MLSITGGFLQAPGVADSAEFGSRIPGRYSTYVDTATETNNATIIGARCGVITGVYRS